MTPFQVDSSPNGACPKVSFLQHGTGENSSEREGLFFGLAFSLADSNRPNNQTEGNLVKDVGQVVNNIQGVGTVGRAAAGEVTEEVADGVNGPTEGHDQTHCFECRSMPWMDAGSAAM